MGARAALREGFADAEILCRPDAQRHAVRPLALRMSDMRLADMPDYRERGYAPTCRRGNARANYQH